MLGKLSMIGAVAAIIMIPHSALSAQVGGASRESTTAPPSARASSFARRCPRSPPPKACGGCALKAFDCKDRVAGPQRSGIRMDVSDRCAPGKMRSRASTSPAQERVSAEPSKG
jgi:hypothetical protein